MPEEKANERKLPSWDGDYLIVGPKKGKNKMGYNHGFSEPEFLEQNVSSFKERYNLNDNQIMIYEMKEVDIKKMKK